MAASVRVVGEDDGNKEVLDEAAERGVLNV